jgi:hypothetical protein
MASERYLAEFEQTTLHKVEWRWHHDQMQAMQLLDELRGEGNNEYGIEGARAEAERLVRHYWPCIQGIANELLDIYMSNDRDKFHVNHFKPRGTIATIDYVAAKKIFDRCKP